MKLLIAASVLSFLGNASTQAAECPDAQTAVKGFVAECAGAGKTEVFHVGKTDIRTIYRFGDRVLQETTLFQGLFELERITEGKRVVHRPLAELSGKFPPIVGKTLTAKFEDTDAGQKATLTVALRVRKQDALYIGPCQYKVLRIDRSAGYGNNSPQFLETDYYAPDLTFIIAKEYKEDNGSTTLNKYDKIYPMNP